MDFSEVIAQRYSVRAFRPDPLPRALIERILGDALKSASWCNTQPWQVIITEGAGTDRFREALWSHVNSGKGANPDIPFPVKYHGAHYDRRKTCAMQLYASLGIADGDLLGGRGHAVGLLARHRARELGVNPDCLVRAGTTDSIAAFLAAGVDRPGEAVTSLGTTLVLKLLSDLLISDAVNGY